MINTPNNLEMNNLPNISVMYQNGNLLRDIAVLDGIMGLVATGSTPALLAEPLVVYNLQDAVDQGITIEDEPFAYFHIQEFYKEVAGKQKLFVMLVDEDTTLTDMVTHTNTTDSVVKLLDFAEGEIRMVGVCRQPPVSYNPGNGFFDTDVETAITAAKALGDFQLGKLDPVRVVIEGRVVDETETNTVIAKNSSNGYAMVVVGGSTGNGMASVGLLLGRAAKYPAHVKVGKVANGPLQVDSMYIGATEVKDFAGLDTLAGNGFLVPMKHKRKAGYYFATDRMCSDDDFRRLVFGRLADKATIIAQATYVEKLEGEVEMNPDGKIDELFLSTLEAEITQNINAQMDTQLSGNDVYINPSQNLINTPELEVELRLQPLGYLEKIKVIIGLVSTL